MVTTKVFGTLYSQSGQGLATAVVNATLTTADIDEETGIVIPVDATTTTDVDGYFEIDLWPNARGRNASQYDIQAAARGWLARITVPDVDSVNIADIVSQEPYPAKDAAQVALEKTQEAFLAAEDSADLATASAA
jgi:hypothetical protein